MKISCLIIPANALIFHLFNRVTHQMAAEKFVRFYGFALKEKLLDLGQYLGSTLDSHCTPSSG